MWYGLHRKRKNKQDEPAKIGVPTGKMAYFTMVDDEMKGLFAPVLVNGQTTKFMNFSFVPQKGYDYNIKYIVDKKRYGYEMTKTNRKTGRTTELDYEGWSSQCDN